VPHICLKWLRLYMSLFCLFVCLFRLFIYLLICMFSLTTTCWINVPHYRCYNNHFTALWILTGTTRVSQYQKKHSLTHTYHGHQSSLICFLHLLRTMASSLFNFHAWQSFCTISVQFSLVYLLVWHPPLHTLCWWFLEYWPVLLLQPFYGPLDCVRNYLGELVPER